MFYFNKTTHLQPIGPLVFDQLSQVLKPGETKLTFSISDTRNILLTKKINQLAGEN
jgi:hypothetical protein